MAWSNSKIFTTYITDVLNNTTAMDANSDTIKVSLYDNSITPSQTVTSANAAYGAGVYASGEQTSSAQWPAGGVALSSVTSGFSSNVYTFDAADTDSGSTATLTVYGGLIYDDTITTPVADQGMCFNYLGGAATVTAGLLRLVWSASGVWSLTL